MKSIILNLLKQGYDFFAVALTTGFIFSVVLYNPLLVIALPSFRAALIPVLVSAI